MIISKTPLFKSAVVFLLLLGVAAFTTAFASNTLDEMAGPPPVIVFDGSPGTAAPPATLGPYTMTPAPDDTRPIGQDVFVTTVPLGIGDLSFSHQMSHVEIGDGWATWSHGYTGDVYADYVGATVTMTLPPGTEAFYFYAEPNAYGQFSITATSNSGITSGPVQVEGNSGARYFGFYTTDPATTISSITVDVASSASGFAVGEFGIAEQGDLLYALNSFVGASWDIARYQADIATDFLDLDPTYINPDLFLVEVKYAFDRDPVSGQVYLLADIFYDDQAPKGVFRRYLCELDLLTGGYNLIGPVVSFFGNLNPQDMTFDGEGNLYVVFQGGELNQISLPSLAPTFLANLPQNPPKYTGAGLTYDFDNDRLLYVMGLQYQIPLFAIDLTSYSYNFLFYFDIPGYANETAQAIEYVGNDKAYFTGAWSLDAIFKLDLNSQLVSTILQPSGFSAHIKDLLFIAGTNPCNNDTEPPVLTCPDLIEENNLPGKCGVVVNYSVTATDNCTDSPWLSCDPPSGSFFDVGTTIVSCTANDDAGLSTTCTFSVTVYDVEPPVAHCMNTVVYLDPYAYAYLSPDEVNNGSSDNCGIVDKDVYPNFFTCDDLGPQEVTLTVYDEAGWSDECTATVEVKKGTGLLPPYVNADVGSVYFPGWATYDPCKKIFTIGSAGNNGNPYQDAHHYVYRQMCCDGSIIAKVTNIQTATGIPGWAGVEMREMLEEAGSKKVSLITRLGNWVYRSVRTTLNGQEKEQQYFSPSANKWLKLVRQGDYFSGYVRNNPSHAWQFRFAAYIPMGDCIWVGLTSESYSPYVESVATFKKVKVSGPCFDVPMLVEFESELEESLQPGLDVKLYPNPANHVLNVDVNQQLEEAATLEILDLNGRLIETLHMDALLPKVEIDLESMNLANGVYILNVRTQTEVISRRFVKS